MSKDLLETINNVYNELIELKNEQNDFRVDIAKHITSMSRDTEWMREKIDGINNKFDKCGFCKSEDGSITFKKSIQDIKDEQNRIKYIAVGAASVLSIVITTIFWAIQNKDKIFP